MKKTLVAVLGLAMLAPMAWAQTNVLSQNAVGYVKVDMAPGALYLLRNDFETIDGSPSDLNTIIGDQLPQGTTVSIWDRQGALGGEYVSYSYVPQTFLQPAEWPAGMISIARGDAFFVEVGPGAGVIEMYMLGEVPGANNGAEMTSVGTVDFDAVGYPYPAAVQFDQMALVAAPEVGSTVNFWDSSLQAFVSGSFVSQAFLQPAEWPAGIGDRIVQPGEGFFYDTSVAVVWDETKPYAWP